MRLPEPGSIQIAPSILSADFARLADEIGIVESAGLSILHIDVMDGHFVPNITIGPPVVAALRKCTDLCLDCHLMISDPQRYIPRFVDAGADHITFHAEATEVAGELIDQIHAAGCTAGISVKPDTPVSVISDVAANCEMILIMSVYPGFGGQRLIPETLDKAVELRKRLGPSLRIQVDGGICESTAELAVSKGIDTLVAGNAIFGQTDRIAAIEALRRSTRPSERKSQSIP